MAELKENAKLKLAQGQALVEYVLIITLVVIAFAVALAATGPALGNVFSNTIRNLVGSEERDVSELPDAEEFWLTVTWVATQTPEETPLATRTVPPPSRTPTPGPSPTETPVTPTKTHTPTKTPPPSPTPGDMKFTYPFEDSADEVTHWRLDNSFYLGTEDWFGMYYDNATLSGEPVEKAFNAEIDPSFRDRIRFDWGTDSPVLGLSSNEFSVTFRRLIYITEETTLNFNIPTVNDGIRVWIVGESADGTVDYGGTVSLELGGPGGCSATGTTSGGSGSSTSSSSDWTIYDDDHGSYSDDCLIVDRWKHGARSGTYNVRRTVPAGNYMLQVDYYDYTGDADIQFEVGSADFRINPDDARINSGGSDTGGTPVCGWFANADERANSLENMWEEYPYDTFQQGSRCYLELRGAIPVPADADATLTFWDVWDLAGSTFTWVEIADYDAAEVSEGVIDRSALVWQRFDLHNGNTFNYNWTQHTIPIPADLRDTEVTLRFGMENRDAAGTNKWFIDTIEVGPVTRPDLYTALEWNLSDASEAEDFIASGHWQLTSENALGGGGMAWHESPGRDYYRFPETRNSGSFNIEQLRVHSIEFNGFIDLSSVDGITDMDGDGGDPMLSFWHMYDVRKYTGLEIQYTTDPYSYGDAANWQVVPSTGALVARDHDSNLVLDMMEYVEIPLNTIGETRFRLRFAMTVHQNANNDDGWWIDNIRLEREGRPEFTRFPFLDTAENDSDFANWLATGSWGRIPGGHRPDGGTRGSAYTDSPAGNYLPNTNSALSLKYPFDIRLDTPTNPRSPVCDTATTTCETPDIAPVDPILTFWHYRELASGEDFWVEWKRQSDSLSEWQPLWAYMDRMTRLTSSSSNDTRVSYAWERVEIDLEPVISYVTNPANYVSGIPDSEQDDVVFRFRFETSGSNEANGIYIDNIEVKERPSLVHNLWETSETVTDPEDGTVFGSGTSFYDGIDNLGSGWHIGGDWLPIWWEQRGGLYSFHSSPAGQASSPPDSPVTDHVNRESTYSVLELARQIDLRGASTSDQPILYFWSRYGLDNQETARVQVSVKDPSVTADGAGHCSGGLKQCYEHLYGWTEWEDIWVRGEEDDGDRIAQRTYTWQREQASLVDYAGDQIRIRFVSDSLSNSADTWDGWYVDEISIKYYDPRIISIGRDIDGGVFFDPAANTRNWVTEGIWGLSPEFFRGSGGGPVDLGGAAWDYKYWDITSLGGNQWQIPSRASNFLNSAADSTTPDASGSVLEINNDWGFGGPAGLTTTDRFVGRWELITGNVGAVGGPIPGTYTFITTSDDGVRFKYDTYPTTGGLPDPVEPDDPPKSGWNIINNWTVHGRTVDMGIAKLAAPSSGTQQYKFTLEYFEYTDDAVIQVSTGSNSFSFTDSPKQGAGLAYNEVGAVHRSNSSMILDGVFDFSGAGAPVLEYYTYHELGGNAVVEVTRDGGFTWETSGLGGSVPNSYFSGPWQVDYWESITSGNSDTRRRLDYDPDGPPYNNPSLYPPKYSWTTTDIDYEWGNGRPFGDSKYRSDNFGLRFTREITVPIATTFNFTIRGDDGMRLWLNYTEGCATIVDGGVAKTVYSGGPRTDDRRAYDDDDIGGDSCLLIDNWKPQGPTTTSVTRTIPAGTHTLQLDWYENGGGAVVQLEMGADGFDAPLYDGTWMPDDGDWAQKRHDLGEFAGFPQVGLRFRLDRLSRSDEWEGGDFQSNWQSSPWPNWEESWWIVDIRVTDE